MTDTAVGITDTLDFSHEAIRLKQLQDSENSNAAINIASIIAGVASGSFPVVKAGASGTAGEVDIFPATASKGKTSLTASNNTGNTTTNINTAAQGGARTYTVPDAGSNASFILSGGTSAVAAGAMPLIPRATVAATGSTVSDAAPIAVGFTSVTASNGTKGVVLPTAPIAGTVVILKNTVAATLKLYPDAAATINAISSNGPIVLANLVTAILIADSPTQWYTIPLLPS